MELARAFAGPGTRETLVEVLRVVLVALLVFCDVARPSPVGCQRAAHSLLHPVVPSGSVARLRDSLTAHFGAFREFAILPSLERGHDWGVRLAGQDEGIVSAVVRGLPLRVQVLGLRRLLEHHEQVGNHFLILDLIWRLLRGALLAGHRRVHLFAILAAEEAPRVGDEPVQRRLHISLASAIRLSIRAGHPHFRQLDALRLHPHRRRRGVSASRIV